jgi:RNA recognition motif-containing protein
MATTIVVENLPADMTEDGLEDVFAQVGTVQSVKIRQELLTLLNDHPQEYGVVEMALGVDAYRAINCFEGATFKDRKIHVKEAYPLLEKAKTAFEHIIDGHSLPNFNPRASFERWKDQLKDH